MKCMSVVSVFPPLGDRPISGGSSKRIPPEVVGSNPDLVCCHSIRNVSRIFCCTVPKRKKQITRENHEVNYIHHRPVHTIIFLTFSLVASLHDLAFTPQSRQNNSTFFYSPPNVCVNRVHAEIVSFIHINE